jgi:hypothetical protein
MHKLRGNIVTIYSAVAKAANLFRNATKFSEFRSGRFKGGKRGELFRIENTDSG